VGSTDPGKHGCEPLKAIDLVLVNAQRSLTALWRIFDAPGVKNPNEHFKRIKMAKPTEYPGT